MQDLGRVLLGIGVLIILIGLAMLLLGRLGLGKMPGDLVFRRGNFTLYFPIVSCIVISIVLSLLLWLFRR